MNKKENGFASVFVLLVLVVILLGVVYTIFRNKDNEKLQNKTSEEVYAVPTLQQVDLKTFKASSAMDFTIELSSNYQIIEDGPTVIISGQNGRILVGQNGTDYDNLKDYIKNSKNDLEDLLSRRNNLIINGLESINGFIDKEKIYLIYIDNKVYFLSTTDVELYPDLDQIAQSFQYTP